MTYDQYMHELGRDFDQLNKTTIAPSLPLQHLVRNYFVLLQESQFATTTQWYILPDNCAHLIFYLFEQGNTVVPKCSLVGPRSRHILINRRNRLFTFICTFKPGGLAPFVAMPLDALKNQSTEACHVLKGYRAGVFDQLTMNALRFDVPEFARCLESFLLSVSKGLPGVHPVVKAFYNQLADPLAQLRLATVAEKLGYSDRHLRNLVLAHIGHSPKMVTQIERFTSSLLQNNQQQNWASIAHASGYYDQSHMISDYHKLVGTSPEKLFS
ncbi:MAG: AraC family transcriptional regulator [Imperialibacter sp.]|uniref:AraC family transcriptional regulator n=1 Tax=Imperialibacter sp. TaxID=2038411 RepID=UPI0032EF874D